MVTIQITSWESGFNKVEFNKMLRRKYGYNIAEAKKIVDDILNNKTVSIEFNNMEEANLILHDFNITFSVK